MSYTRKDIVKRFEQALSQRAAASLVLRRWTASPKSGDQYDDWYRTTVQVNIWAGVLDAVDHHGVDPTLAVLMRGLDER